MNSFLMDLKEKVAVKQADLTHGRNDAIDSTVRTKKSFTPESFTRKGFTLIELLVAITIIGIMMAAIIPFFGQKPGYERKQFVAHLNALVQFAWQQAIITRAVHRILFDFTDRTATVERHVTTTPVTQKLDFQSLTGTDAQMSWPASLIFKEFLIEGVDEMKQFVGRAVQTIWFYIIPDGMTQQVTINGIDKEDKINNKSRPFSLVLNPYLAQFKEYDTFQK